MSKPRVLIATGASGGHVFPALATAEALLDSGAEIQIALGGPKFEDLVQKSGHPYVKLPAGAFNVRSIFRKLKALVLLVFGVVKALRVIQHWHPHVILATGGYGCVAVTLAARVAGVPLVLHEQNVAPGRANRFLAQFADYVAVTFAPSRAIFAPLLKAGATLHVTGNPTRAAVTAVANSPLTPAPPYRILVLGGSQGARILSDVVPQALARLPESLRRQVHVQHQAPLEAVARTLAAYQDLALPGMSVSPFIEDIPQALQAAHLVIGRAGTGVVVETSLVGRPAIYVPHPLADGHQFENAKVAEEAGAAVILAQDVFTPETLVPHIQSILTDGDRRTAMAHAAQKLFQVDGDMQLAQLVLNCARQDVMNIAGK